MKIFTNILIAQILFTAVNQLNADEKKLLHFSTDSVTDLLVEDNVNMNNEKLSKMQVFLKVPVNNENTDCTKLNLQQYVSYGSLCIRELFRFLVSLCNPVDKQNTEVMTHLGLTLLQVSLEISADTLSKFPSLLSLVKDELSRYLIIVCMINKGNTRA